MRVVVFLEAAVLPMAAPLFTLPSGELRTDWHNFYPSMINFVIGLAFLFPYGMAQLLPFEPSPGDGEDVKDNLLGIEPEADVVIDSCDVIFCVVIKGLVNKFICKFN